MKGELFEFVLEQSGVIPEIPHLHMVAPKGAQVINPSVPWYERHVAEIKQRFPSSSYARHPELTRGRQAAMAAWLYRNATAVRYVATTVALPVVAGATAATIVGPALGKGSKPSGVDMYSPEIARYEESSYGTGLGFRMI